MDGIELMATAMHAARERLELAAANLANVSSERFQRRVAHVGLGERGLEVTSRVDAVPGPLERTERAFDLVANGGAFYLRDRDGGVERVRSASLTAGPDGVLADSRGRVLLGEAGPVRASAAATVDARGQVHDGERTVQLRVAAGTEIRSGFLERPNVDAIGEMVRILDAQRAFETAEKTLGAIDEARAKATGDVGRAKQ